MTMLTIVPIVEGGGEVNAVPILIERWRRFRRYRNVQVHVRGPVRASGKGALTVAHDGTSELGVEYYVELAFDRRPDAILVLLDADEDCPKTLGARLLARARAMVPLGSCTRNSFLSWCRRDDDSGPWPAVAEIAASRESR